MKINNWKCDICGLVFESQDYDYKNNLSMKIEIPSIWAGNNKVFEFADTCSACRSNIKSFIEKLIDPL